MYEREIEINRLVISDRCASLFALTALYVPFNFFILHFAEMKIRWLFSWICMRLSGDARRRIDFRGRMTGNVFFFLEF